MAYNFKPRKIIENKAQCLLCEDVLISKTHYDFQKCSCGNLSVDGGKDYVKRGIKDGTKYKELSTYVKETI